MYSQIRHHVDDWQSIAANHMLDPVSASVLLHCLTLDAADRLLRGEPHQTDLADVALMVWARFRDSLRTLSDDPDVDANDSPSIRLCVSDAVARLQPAVCLRMFVASMKAGCKYRPSSAWNPTPAMRWYVSCSRQFDSTCCDDFTLISLLGDASRAIETFVAAMSRLQMLAVNRTVLNSLDSHLRSICFQRVH